jgi:3-phosphoshikimate 1-carboxyvinyltransferase
VVGVRLRIVPGRRLAGEIRVPGDKSIAHRWLILAATAVGRTRLGNLPPALDVRSTATCLAQVSKSARPVLEAWAHEVGLQPDGDRSTWNEGLGESPTIWVEVEGEGRRSLVEAGAILDCGNSGTSLRLLAGVLASRPFRTVLGGDESLSVRPMERVAEPLRRMGARVDTTDGHAPVTVIGGPLSGIHVAPPIPSAQVKGAVLFGALDAEGPTTVTERTRTRDHTERAMAALGAPVRIDGTTIGVEPFQHAAFSATVPGDPSSAAYLVAAAALTGSALAVRDVGLNPSRLGYLEVMSRMGVPVETAADREELGEPVGSIVVHPAGELRGTNVDEEELPLVVDEVPVLASMAAHATGESRFSGAEELRVKESDRLAGLADGIRSLGGEAGVEGSDLVVAGGGLDGGEARSAGDHRMAMAFVVAALAARSPSEILGVEASSVSFPGFARVLATVGANVEAAG